MTEKKPQHAREFIQGSPFKTYDAILALVKCVEKDRKKKGTWKEGEPVIFYGSVIRLAAKNGTSTDTEGRNLKKLVNDGWLVQVAGQQRSSNSGSFGTKSYRVICPAEWLMTHTYVKSPRKKNDALDKTNVRRHLGRLGFINAEPFVEAYLYGSATVPQNTLPAVPQNTSPAVPQNTLPADNVSCVPAVTQDTPTMSVGSKSVSPKPEKNKSEDSKSSPKEQEQDQPQSQKREGVLESSPRLTDCKINTNPAGHENHPETIGIHFLDVTLDSLTDGNLDVDEDGNEIDRDDVEPHLIDCVRAAVAAKADRPYAGLKTHAIIMRDAMNRLRKEYGKNVPCCWLPIMDEFKGGKAVTPQKAVGTTYSPGTAEIEKFRKEQGRAPCQEKNPRTGAWQVIFRTEADRIEMGLTVASVCTVTGMDSQGQFGKLVWHKASE